MPKKRKKKAKQLEREQELPLLGIGRRTVVLKNMAERNSRYDVHRWQLAADAGRCWQMLADGNSCKMLQSNFSAAIPTCFCST
jgi:hypothetical protein